MYYILIALLSDDYWRLKVDANCSDMIRSLINIMIGSTETVILVIRIQIRIVIGFFLTTPGFFICLYFYCIFATQPTVNEGTSR